MSDDLRAKLDLAQAEVDRTRAQTAAVLNIIKGHDSLSPTWQYLWHVPFDFAQAEARAMHNLRTL